MKPRLAGPPFLCWGFSFVGLWSMMKENRWR
nr:MAG TPA: hypothetical protein [Caudoviricetes sp.]